MEDLVHTNHLGYKQYVNTDGKDVCIDCHRPYTNKGEGLLCPVCDDDFYGTPDALEFA